MMKTSLHDFMKVGIVHFMAFPGSETGEGDISRTVAQIVDDAFFEGIEITRVNDAAERDKVRTLLQTSGVAVGFGAQPYILGGRLNLNSFDEEERNKAIEILKGAIDQAYEFGAKKFGFLSGPRPDKRKDDDEAARLLADSIVELGLYAKSKGDLMLSLETFDDSTDKKAFIGSNRLAVEVAREVRKAVSDFGLMVDLSHLPMQDETIREALSVTREFINHAHIGTCVIRDRNSPAYGDLHPYFGHPLGECHVPQVREFLRGLLDNGYLVEDAPERNIVAFEVKPDPSQSSATVIADAKRTLREAWRLL